MRKKYIAEYLKKSYKKLYSYFGPQHWWPADSAFEVVIGAILTQNTAWANAAKAITCLKKEKLLNPTRLYSMRVSRLAQVIRPCGYYNIKADRVKNFLEVLFVEFKGRLTSMLALDTITLREKLLEIKGIGPETADSILLYAAKKPVFVVDAYTRRLLLRHNWINGQDNYQQIQNLFTENLPHHVELFNEYHALIVRLGKKFCRTKQLCTVCPLRENGGGWWK